MSNWKLVDQDTGAELTIGDERMTFRNSPVNIESWLPPDEPGSTGRVYVKFGDGSKSAGLFPGVVNAKFIDHDAADLTVENEGNIYILRAWSNVGWQWVSGHIPEHTKRWYSNGFVVGHGIEEIVQAAINDGLVVK